MCSYLRVVDLDKTISNLWNTTLVGSSLDGVEAATIARNYYVTDRTAGKIYVVNSNWIGYDALIDSQNQGTADLEFMTD